MLAEKMTENQLTLPSSTLEIFKEEEINFGTNQLYLRQINFRVILGCATRHAHFNDLIGNGM